MYLLLSSVFLVGLAKCLPSHWASQGDPTAEDSKVPKEAVAAALLEFYDLDIDADQTFGRPGDGLTKADLTSFLVPPEEP